jgi:ComF family protein
VVFPRKCVGCGRHGDWLCAGCADAVHWLKPPLCDCCGREIGAGSRCQECARERPRIDGIRACSRFEGAIRQAIHRLKYGGQRSLAQPLAELQVQVARQLPRADAVVPVPLHPARERRRGYNQSALLATELAGLMGLPLEPAARRVRETEDQVKLDRRARQANVKGAFACLDPSAIAGRRLLLVDDVCTTGSTLLACAEPMLRAGAAGVWGLVVARQDEERT